MDNVFNQLKEQKAAQAKESECLNKGRPVPRRHRNPDEEKISWQLRTKTSFSILSSDNRYCKATLDELKSIKLREMKVPMVHTGKYLVCQSIGTPLPVIGFIFEASDKDKEANIAGINLLIQDLNGDVEEVDMYNFLHSFHNLDWISPGTILIIKEPWLRYNSQGKIPSIHIYSPSDVIFVDPNDKEFLNKIGAMKWYIKMTKDPEVWREKGNECFKKGDFEKAIFLYDRGIRCNPELPVLYLNKASACLRIDAYYMAYEAAEIALNKNGDREKALYRMGRAAYGMREWKKAAAHFLEILKESPQHSDATKERKRATTRLAEQRDGKYNFKSMHLESKKEQPNLDVADYKGPIEIANIPGKGRGIVATNDIKEGTLLVVSKAFSTGYSQDYPAGFFKIQTNGGTHMMQEIKTMQNLQKNPQRAKEIYDLYAGDMSHEEMPDGVIDAERIQKICHLNRWGSRDDNDNVSDCSLYFLPSYFNHACLANSYRKLYGDVMVIRAISDINKGDEITVSYLSPSLGLTERQKNLSDWGFTCHCKLCKMDAADPYCSKRNQMLEDFERQIKNYSPQEIIEKGEPLLKKIRETYVNRKELQVVLAQMLNILSCAYAEVRNTKKIIQCLEEILTLMDNPLKHAIGLADICADLAFCYTETFSAASNAKFKAMVDKAMQLSFCVDFKHFQMLYPKFAFPSSLGLTFN